MTQGIYKVLRNQKIAPSVFKMELDGDTSALTRPGQFINFKIDGLYLRRPISVCDYTENTITVIYKVVGAGTEIMSKACVGDCFDILVGLGNGFDTDKESQKPLLIGGGVGIPPLYKLCKELIEKGKTVSVILGFNSKEEIFCKDEFEKLGANVLVTTVDGTYGIKGFVTDAFEETDFDFFYTCGPEPMFKAIEKTADSNISGQYSFEERMGCGFGACMGCTCKTKYGNKRICKDGPVLDREEIIW